jgi:hypothetical protein
VATQKHEQTLVVGVSGRRLSRSLSSERIFAEPSVSVEVHCYSARFLACDHEPHEQITRPLNQQEQADQGGGGQ